MSKLLSAVQKLNIFRTFTQRRYCTKTTLDVNTNVAKDVILFRHENSKFFKVINIFGVCQFGFWTYLAIFAYTNLRDAPTEKSETTAWWRTINLGENKYRNTIGMMSFLIGWGVLSMTWMYSLRSVRYLILRKGGQDVSFVTYTPAGTNQILTVNLKDVSCREMRTAAKTQLPIKVKGKFMHYLLDMKGEFRNASLFDHTAGLQRNISKK